MFNTNIPHDSEPIRKSAWHKIPAPRERDEVGGRWQDAAGKYRNVSQHVMEVMKAHFRMSRHGSHSNCADTDMVLTPGLRVNWRLVPRRRCPRFVLYNKATILICPLHLLLTKKSPKLRASWEGK